jgi:VanZ family protein
MAIKIFLKRYSQIAYIVLFIGCVIVVSWGIFISTPPQAAFHQSDKILHVLAFALLAFTGRGAMQMLSPFLFWPVIAAIAMLMEYLQGALQATRISSLEDALANLVGVGLAFLAVKAINKQRVS